MMIAVWFGNKARTPRELRSSRKEFRVTLIELIEQREVNYLLNGGHGQDSRFNALLARSDEQNGSVLNGLFCRRHVVRESRRTKQGVEVLCLRVTYRDFVVRLSFR